MLDAEPDVSPRAFVHSASCIDVRMTIAIRQAQPSDAAAVEALLVEAAQWVDALGEVMWEESEIEPERIARETAAGLFYLAGTGLFVWARVENQKPVFTAPEKVLVGVVTAVSAVAVLGLVQGFVTV